MTLSDPLHVCPLHPQAEAAAQCEYCTQPHCADCLTPFLGRRYCPGCLAQVRAMANYPTAPAAAALPVSPQPHPIASYAPTQPDRPRLPGWASALVYLGSFLVFMLLAQAFLSVEMTVARLFGGRAVPPRGAIMDTTGLGVPLWALLFGLWGWLTLGGVLAVTAGFGRLLERRSLLDLGLRARPTVWRDLVVGLALAAVLFISVVGVGAGKGWYEIYNRVQGADALAITFVGFLILLPLAAVEEIAVRGYLMQALNRSFGRWPAILVSSGIFAILHGMNPEAGPLAMLGIFLAGVYLAVAYQITGNLWLPIFIHTGWNLLEGPIFGLPVSGFAPPIHVLQVSDTGPALWTGARFGPEAGLLLCGMLGVHLAALWAMKPLLEARPEAERPVTEPAPARPIGPPEVCSP